MASPPAPTDAPPIPVATVSPLRRSVSPHTVPESSSWDETPPVTPPDSAVEPTQDPPSPATFLDALHDLTVENSWDESLALDLAHLTLSGRPLTWTQQTLSAPISYEHFRSVFAANFLPLGTPNGPPLPQPRPPPFVDANTIPSVDGPMDDLFDRLDQGDFTPDVDMPSPTAPISPSSPAVASVATDFAPIASLITTADTTDGPAEPPPSPSATRQRCHSLSGFPRLVSGSSATSTPFATGALGQHHRLCQRTSRPTYLLGRPWNSNTPPVSCSSRTYIP